MAAPAIPTQAAFHSVDKCFTATLEGDFSGTVTSTLTLFRRAAAALKLLTVFFQAGSEQTEQSQDLHLWDIQLPNLYPFHAAVAVE